MLQPSLYPNFVFHNILSKRTNLAPKICFLLKIPLHFFFSKSLFNPLLFNYKTQYLCDFVNGLSLSAQKPNLTKHTLLQNMRLFWIRFPSFFLFFLVSSYISEAQRPPMRSTTNLAPFKIWGFYFYLFFIFK